MPVDFLKKLEKCNSNVKTKQTEELEIYWKENNNKGKYIS